MIQRVQTIYLILVIIASSLCFSFPLAKYNFQIAGTPSKAELKIIPDSSLNSLDEISQAGFINTLPLLILTSLVCLLCALTIFLYKNRKIQVRLIAICLLIVMSIIAINFLYYTDQFKEVLSKNFKTVVEQQYWLGSILPLISLVLLYLANRAIRKDEALVRSSNQLR